MKNFLKNAYLGLICFFLYAPIFVLMVLSFNASKSRAVWGGFTFDWYIDMFNSSKIMDALFNSLSIALISSIVATILGLLACIGINSMRSVPKAAMMSLNNIPMLNAEIVTGLSLMICFAAFGISLNYNTVLLSHITFCVPYVILSIMPKLKQTNISVYEAAMDLGAHPVYAFIKVVLPDLIPGIVSGFLLSFTMSLDDFVISYFTKGRINTLSTLVYTQLRRGINPTMYALSTIMFLAVLLLLLASNFMPKQLEKILKRNKMQQGAVSQEEK